MQTMERDLRKSIEHRRSYYVLGNTSPVPDSEIEEIIKLAVEHVPSAFNSQSARLVLLLGEHHDKLWQIVKDTLKKILAASAFAVTEAKIDKSFASGYGTVLFFEDESVVQTLQNSFPLYQERFPEWSQQTSAMHQFAVWTMLEDAGFGASLQHYNPLIDRDVKAEWRLPENWRLIAQMPFGMPLEPPGKKEIKPLEERMKIFK